MRREEQRRREERGERREATIALHPSPFIIYPAIDLRNGRVVRLKFGDPNQQTTFSDDPVAIAQQWVAAGATWLHVVNLDGAFDEAGTANWQILPQLTQQGAKVQFGGGVRSLDDVARVLDAGVARVILGTVAIEQPELVAAAIAQFGADKIAVGIDARDGVVKTRGWLRETAVSPLELGTQMKAIGVQTVIYTDISRDGVLTGVNVTKTAELAETTGLHVIASGGVASLQDIEQTLAVADKGVVGVITGRALYDGRLDLREAIEVTKC
ncbi:MAG: 1-(5-phosphoribosyl)-5-[(5-phosphoribosylamino)methylideneamino]imidazole-4-carboxamide isomerase [Ardenticatenaceae bacterium]|nr:1-(5-phosphoribosyl)-5-[(5-phosphoribosylamino)methylideneamino]imidazole-4-carboxamide isomerase [Ardenticatenaceae bacterium]